MQCEALLEHDQLYAAEFVLDSRMLAFEPHQFIADRDLVAAGVSYKARVKSTGRTYEGETVHVFRFHNGKVVSFKENLDTVMMASAYKAA